MEIFNIYARNSLERLVLGHRGENLARQVIFDLTPMIQEFGEGTFRIINLRHGSEELPYQVAVTSRLENLAIWHLTDTDMGVEGNGECQLRYYVNDVLCKTDVYQTTVLESLCITGTTPDPYHDLLEDIEVVVDNLELIQNVPNLAQQAADSASDSEAWAVGERNGEPVESDDPTYENNSKFWANQAAASALSIDPDDFLAPTAEQMLSDKGETDDAPYLFRRSAGNGADRRFDELVGGSVAWNQLVANGNFASSSGWSVSQTSTSSLAISGNVATITMTDTDRTGGIQRSITVAANHVCIVSVDINPSHAVTTARIRLRNTSEDYSVYSPTTSASANSWAKVSGLLKPTASCNKFYAYAFINEDIDGIAANDTFQFRNAILIDLTAMFGNTIADYIYTLEQTDVGSGIALLKSWGFCTKPYYAYTQPTLMSVKTTAHETVGFNQWDEETELGNIQFDTNGANIPDTTRLRTKNYIPCLPNTTYYLTAPVTDIKAGFYDANYNYLGSNKRVDNAGNRTFTSPDGAAYFKFRLAQSYGTTYNHDICLNLSWSGTHNGEYEPYIKRTYPIDDVELRGIPKLNASNQLYYDGDTYESDGTVTRRFASVDMGTLGWNYSSFDGIYVFSANVSEMYKPKSGGHNRILCTAYPQTPTATSSNNTTVALMSDKEIQIKNESTQIYVKDSSYTDKDTFTTAVTGQYLIYELAESTTEEAEPFQSPMILYPDGTERFVDERSVLLPVGHETFYPVNQRAKLDGLPSDFSTLIAPTEKTNKASQNYAVGAYLILNNQLYKVTSAITTGQKITPNTNVTATTVMAEIMALA